MLILSGDILPAVSAVFVALAQVEWVEDSCGQHPRGSIFSGEVKRFPIWAFTLTLSLSPSHALYLSISDSLTLSVPGSKKPLDETEPTIILQGCLFDVRVRHSALLWPYSGGGYGSILWPYSGWGHVWDTARCS